AFLFRHERVRGTDSVCFHHRKRSSMSGRLLTTIEAQMYVAQLTVTRLLDEVEIVAPNALPTLDPDEYDRDPRTVAQLVRSLWKIPRGPIPNLVDVIESAGGVVVFRDFGTQKLDGMSCWPRKGPPLFFV